MQAVGGQPSDGVAGGAAAAAAARRPVSAPLILTARVARSTRYVATKAINARMHARPHYNLRSIYYNMDIA